MKTLYIIDLLGTMVFAISGALTAADKKMDIFGISSVAFITALGGGTLRDLLLGKTPVGWMTEINYLMMIGIGITLGLLFRNVVKKLRRTFFFFDTVGIAVFTILGLQKALNAGVSPVICVMMGMISAVFGGVIRDIICNEVPLIFRKEVYALACLVGGCFYFILKSFEINSTSQIFIACLSIIIIRILAVKFKWKLPTL